MRAERPRRRGRVVPSETGPYPASRRARLRLAPPSGGASWAGTLVANSGTDGRALFVDPGLDLVGRRPSRFGRLLSVPGLSSRVVLRRDPAPCARQTPHPPGARGGGAGRSDWAARLHDRPAARGLPGNCPRLRAAGHLPGGDVDRRRGGRPGRGGRGPGPGPRVRRGEDGPGGPAGRHPEATLPGGVRRYRPTLPRRPRGTRGRVDSTIGGRLAIFGNLGCVLHEPGHGRAGAGPFSRTRRRADHARESRSEDDHRCIPSPPLPTSSRPTSRSPR